MFFLQCTMRSEGKWGRKAGNCIQASISSQHEQQAWTVAVTNNFCLALAPLNALQWTISTASSAQKLLTDVRLGRGKATIQKFQQDSEYVSKVRAQPHSLRVTAAQDLHRDILDSLTISLWLFLEISRFSPKHSVLASAFYVYRIHSIPLKSLENGRLKVASWTMTQR